MQLTFAFSLPESSASAGYQARTWSSSFCEWSAPPIPTHEQLTVGGHNGVGRASTHRDHGGFSGTITKPSTFAAGSTYQPHGGLPTARSREHVLRQGRQSCTAPLQKPANSAWLSASRLGFLRSLTTDRPSLKQIMAGQGRRSGARKTKPPKPQWFRGLRWRAVRDSKGFSSSLARKMLGLCGTYQTGPVAPCH